MADFDLEKKRAVHEEGSSSSQERQVKLDQHGFALRPQPSDDPKGEWHCRESSIANNHRSTELEQMAEAMGACAGLFFGLSRPLHSGSHRTTCLSTGQRTLTIPEFRFPATGKITAH